MVDGESGILAICPNGERPDYKKSERKLVWPSGAQSLIFTADEPERLRGKQHEKLWADEVASWRYEDSWAQAQFGLRLGSNPQSVITTTPKPKKLIKELLKASTTHITRGSTYDNRANLAPQFFNAVIKKYEGTRLGRQELNAEVLDDVEGALWTRTMIDDTRMTGNLPDMRRVVVALDPAVSAGEESDETGLIVAGLGVDGFGYVLADLTCKLTPDGWARRAVNAYHEYGADRIVAEVNNGGELVRTVIQTIDARASYKAVHASRGKAIRAEPISALYEQKRIRHVAGLELLEDQLCDYSPMYSDKSPDRMDALVWAFTELFGTQISEPRIRSL
jgi:phage terminase large subunit-like protein